MPVKGELILENIDRIQANFELEIKSASRAASPIDFFRWLIFKHLEKMDMTGLRMVEIFAMLLLIR